MRKTAILLVLGATACGGGGDGATGPTLAQLTEAHGKVHGFQPWDQAETALKAAAGEPTVVEGDAWKWVAREGETCHTLTVARMHTTVASVALEETPCP